tara:strand:+ start:2564 stop:2842 length:279 start_codon:yes stop_codon:yes gene_type:complete
LRTLRVIERSASGAKLNTCPWRAFIDPVVRDVLALHASAVVDREGSVHLASLRAQNPYQHLWEGVQLYTRLLNQNLAELREVEAKKAKHTRG